MPFVPASPRTKSTTHDTRGDTLIAVLHYLITVSPLLLSASMYALAWRAARLLGHWPRPYLDDPKFAVPADHVFDVLDLVNLLLLLSIANSLVLFPLLCCWLWRRHGQWGTLGLLVIFMFGWVVLRTLPPDLTAWMLD